MASSEVERLYSLIYQVVKRIPRGRVATYGQVAELAGIPGGARVCGAALKVSKPKHQLPWQRVIGKASKLRGRIAIYDPVGAAIQRQLLEKEGVPVGDTGLIKLDEYGWLPIPQTGFARPKVARAPRARDRAASVTGGSARGASPRRRPRSGSKRRASSSRR
jgi:methylated-DNA-protein-cysteine methyltransferase-like protein